MKILYLYAELMGYQIPVLHEYVTSYGAEVHVVHWDMKKLTPYAPPIIEGITYYKRSENNYKAILKLAEKIEPSIVYVSGWMDKDYLSVCRKLKKSGVAIVAGCDTQWKGTLRQTLGSLYFRLILKKCFNKIWVAGPYQYEYGRRLGFNKNEIVFNCLSADIGLFSRAAVTKSQVVNYPHKLLFLGRFEEVKGIDLLLEVWSNIKDKKDWSLTFIGNGSYKEKLLKRPDIEVKDFMQPADLVKEVNKYGCVILPSLKEPWALVIQEMMAAGLPVLASDACGAAPVFIIPNYNGNIFQHNNIKSLSKAISQIVNCDDSDLKRMSKNAINRSKIISPEIVAASFISVLIK